MKQYTAAFFCAFISMAFLFTACTKTTTIGSDLVESDLENTEFSDDFVLKTSTILGDSVRTFSTLLSSQLANYLIGEYNDPIFGQVRSSVYAQVSVNGAGKPNFGGKTLDSMVLVLPYRDYLYGDISSEYTVDVLTIDQDSVAERSLFSNETINTNMMPIGQYSFTPNITDSITIQVPKGTELGFDDVTVGPQLRIQLDDDFAQTFFDADDATFSSDSAFTEFLNGFKVSPTSQNGGLLDLGLRSNGTAGLFVYYHNAERDTSYQFPISSSDLKFTSYEHDVTGSIADDFLNDVDSGDSLFFVQGLAGVAGVIELPDLSSLEGNIAINKAELVVTKANLLNDTDVYDDVGQLVLSEIDENGNFIVIEDVASALFSDPTTSTVVLNSIRFGGIETEFTDSPSTYSMNITAHLQNVVRGTATNKMRLSVYNRQKLANRSVFYGAGHSEYPVKLRVYYTKF